MYIKGNFLSKREIIAFHYAHVKNQRNSFICWILPDSENSTQKQQTITALTIKLCVLLYWEITAERHWYARGDTSHKTFQVQAQPAWFFFFGLHVNHSK